MVSPSPYGLSFYWIKVQIIFSFVDIHNIDWSVCLWELKHLVSLRLEKQVVFAPFTWILSTLTCSLLLILVPGIVSGTTWDYTYVGWEENRLKSVLRVETDTPGGGWICLRVTEVHLPVGGGWGWCRNHLEKMDSWPRQKKWETYEGKGCRTKFYLL